VKVLRTRSDLAWLADGTRPRPLVLVPTMGALHDGHLALVRHAERLGTAVVSIFVNPLQFSPGEDLASYPRDLAGDLEQLAALDTAAVFAPEAEEMFRGRSGVTVQPGPRAEPLCGADRPQHFAGVLTIVAKLLNLVKPDIVVLGRKDAQQCLVIDEMVFDLDYRVRVVDHPTVRDADGLALSSRNRYLDGPQRKRALALFRALRRAEAVLQAGERAPGAVCAAMRGELAATDRVEYAEVRTVPDLQVPERATGKLLLAVAARVGPARLIDNFVLQADENGCRPAALLSDEEDG
jgi:pantoate--beta-alanine ligase